MPFKGTGTKKKIFYYLGTKTYILLPTSRAVPPSLRAAFCNSLKELYIWLLPFGKFNVYIISP